MAAIAGPMIETHPKFPYDVGMASPADMRTSVSGEPLLDRLRQRETRAAAELFERYAVEVNRLVWRLLGPDSEHNDIVQQVFVEAMAGISRVRDEATLGAWLRGIAVNTVRGELRRRKRRRFFFANDGHEQVERAAAPGSTKGRRVYALLSRLAVDDRQTFLLRYLAGNTLEETAALLGCSLATVKRRLKHAEDKVRTWAASDPELAEMLRGES
jgi:RNA polymerase sigma-70 factor (ECF subfamily)